jgi:hypothetical protein
MLDGERIGLISRLEIVMALVFAAVGLVALSPLWLAWPSRRARI